MEKKKNISDRETGKGRIVRMKRSRKGKEQEMSSEVNMQEEKNIKMEKYNTGVRKKKKRIFLMKEGISGTILTSCAYGNVGIPVIIYWTRIAMIDLGHYNLVILRGRQ